MDIGSKLHQTGEVIQVKILGTIAMIDEGQTDWKIIGIDIQDPLASKFSDISDVDVYMPKLLKSTVEWLRNYKVICMQNVSENTVSFLDGRWKTRQYVCVQCSLKNQKFHVECVTRNASTMVFINGFQKRNGLLSNAHFADQFRERQKYHRSRSGRANRGGIPGIQPGFAHFGPQSSSLASRIANVIYSRNTFS